MSDHVPDQGPNQGPKHGADHGADHRHRAYHGANHMITMGPGRLERRANYGDRRDTYARGQALVRSRGQPRGQAWARTDDRANHRARRGLETNYGADQVANYGAEHGEDNGANVRENAADQ